jgi:PDZ domain-containing protein
MRVQFARNRLLIYIAAAVLAAAIAFGHTPYSLMLPGKAIDLRTVVQVQGHTTPPGALFLTDVRFARRVTPIQLLALFEPGAQLLPAENVATPVTSSAVEYEGFQREAMTESQSIAAFVAERAAGYPVPEPQSRVLALLFARWSPTPHVLHALDMIVSIQGHPVASNADVERVMPTIKPGTRARVAVFRHGRELFLDVPTVARKGKASFGVYMTTIYERPEIPVAVSFHLPKVEGSSAGLMFALQIYRTLRGMPGGKDLRVAGTGTIAYDGSVGPIEGAKQKVIAARAAGASLFLVPRQNYREVSRTRGIRIVPVSNFSQALRALGA